MTDDSSLYAPMTPQPGRDVVGPLGRATRSVGLGSLANRLEDVRDWMQDDLFDLESVLCQLIDSCSKGEDVSRQAAAHLLTRPGKRIRPICVMLGAHLAEVAVDDNVKHLAVACELVHAATLLHDDVIDEGAERRGAATSRVVYGNSASVLGGDYLLIEALERVAKTGLGELMTTLLDTIAQMVSAEALQLEQRRCFTPNRDLYMQVIEGKTASLFRWALCAAPRTRTNGHEPVDISALARAGTALGVAFQLIDDVLDFEGDPGATGKDLFADLAQGKLTWPLIIASEVDKTLADDVRELADGGEIHADDAAAIVARIRDAGAIVATRDFADEQRKIAREALSTLPPSRARSAIEKVIDAAVERRK
jgi:octaprenyl-diphosphate synthase